MIQLELVM